jgi:hypothetical protein
VKPLGWPAYGLRLRASIGRDTPVTVDRIRGWDGKSTRQQGAAPMYVTGVRISGLRSAEDYELAGLDRVVELAPGPTGVAVADALTMVFASLPTRERDGRAMQAAAVRLGLCAAPEQAEVVVENGAPVQVSLPSAAGAYALLQTEHRQVTVTVDLALDPPLFGRLRGMAVRDPRLVTALGAGASMSLKVGWLFTQDLTAVSVSLLGLAVGDAAFPLAGSERPVWLDGLLPDLASRYLRVGGDESVGTVSERLHAAAMHVDPDRRSRYRSAQRSLAAPPFRLGEIELVARGGGIEAAFGAQLLRPRQFGRHGAAALRLAEAVFLQAPDVLVVEDLPGDRDAALAWLGEHVRGAEATLEQVFSVPGGPPAEPSARPTGPGSFA